MGKSRKASGMIFSRAWAMPNAKTFSIPPIRDFVLRHTEGRKTVVDPFARDSTFGTYTNDMNPETSADWHMDAEEFCHMLRERNLKADCLLFDPPYSPRQMSEVYQSVGLEVGTKGTQNAALYKRVRDAADRLMPVGSVCLSFGWNSTGMGKSRGYEITEILLVAHGGAHNDTICVAEEKTKETTKKCFDPSNWL